MLNALILGFFIWFLWLTGSRLSFCDYLDSNMFLLSFLAWLTSILCACVHLNCSWLASFYQCYVTFMFVRVVCRPFTIHVLLYLYTKHWLMTFSLIDSGSPVFLDWLEDFLLNLQILPFLSNLIDLLTLSALVLDSYWLTP